jgi:uncharacterized membrane protein YhfC
MADCLVANPVVRWEQLMEWSISNLRVKSLKAILCKLSLAALVYHLWKQRNDLCFGNTPRMEELIIAQIRWQVRMRILHKGKFRRTAENEALASRWNVQSVL